jgi:hypothetical protein
VVSIDALVDHHQADFRFVRLGFGTGRYNSGQLSGLMVPLAIALVILRSSFFGSVGKVWQCLPSL